MLDGDEPDDGPGADVLFAWLRDLSFVASSPEGVRLHDVVRETVEADVGWRAPARHAAFQSRARHYFADALRTAPTPAVRRQVFGDFLHLYRYHPVAGPLLDRLRSVWSDAALDGAGPLRESDAEAIRDLVETAPRPSRGARGRDVVGSPPRRS